MFICPYCDKPGFKSWHGLKTHVGRKHAYWWPEFKAWIAEKIEPPLGSEFPPDDAEGYLI